MVGTWQAAAILALDMKLILKLVEAVRTCHEIATHPPCAITRALYVTLSMQILSFLQASPWHTITYNSYFCKELWA